MAPPSLRPRCVATETGLRCRRCRTRRVDGRDLRYVFEHIYGRGVDRPPDPDRIVLTRQLAACQGVLDFVGEMTDNWTSLGGPGDFTVPNTIIASIFSRSSRTFEAVVKHLGNKGFGEQGLMLDRSLFEDMVDARWVSLNPELAVERFGAHDRWTRHLEQQVMEAFPEYQSGDEPPPVELTDEQKLQYSKWFGEHGDRSWTGIGLWNRLKAVEKHWDEGPARRQLQFFHRRVHRLHNDVLHLSSTSMGRLPTAPQEGEDGKVLFRFGSSSHMLHAALFSAFWSYSNTLRLVFNVFELNVADRFEQDHFRPIAKELFPLTAEETKGVGRNDPCPCGSRLKYKKCHGY